MRLRVLLLLVAAIVLAGCTTTSTTPPNVVPANMTELKGALGVLPTYAPPVAKAQVNVTVATAGAPVRFASEGSSDPQGLPLAFSWDFGDGGRAQGATVEHAYAAAGEYVARLTVTNAEGLADTAVLNLRIVDANKVPVAVLRIVDASGNPVGAIERGMRVVFDASASTDDGPFNVDWDFGDGTTSHEVKAGHAYATPGRYLVKLQVVDGDGLASTAEALVRVNAVYETTGAFTLSGEDEFVYEFPVSPGLTKLEVRLAFDAGLGSNDLTLVVRDAGNAEVARDAGPTAAGAQGEQVRVVTLEPDVVAGKTPGTWRAVVLRQAVSPAGMDWHLGVRQVY